MAGGFRGSRRGRRCSAARTWRRSIQDEAHRFAIEYHRSLRGKGQVKSVLDDIPGIGPARRKALMREFKDIEAIRAAEVEDRSGCCPGTWGNSRGAYFSGK